VLALEFDGNRCRAVWHRPHGRTALRSDYPEASDVRLQLGRGRVKSNLCPVNDCAGDAHCFARVLFPDGGGVYPPGKQLGEYGDASPAAIWKKLYQYGSRSLMEMCLVSLDVSRSCVIS
jgi:hypothetical protein